MRFFSSTTYEKQVPGQKMGIDLNPFGMTLQGRSFIAENPRFGYQGSERDPEALGGNAYTTDYRMLDVRTGRWFSPDPITILCPPCAYVPIATAELKLCQTNTAPSVGTVMPPTERNNDPTALPVTQSCVTE